MAGWRYLLLSLYHDINIVYDTCLMPRMYEVITCGVRFYCRESAVDPPGPGAGLVVRART
jgi:hypothetical protein